MSVVKVCPKCGDVELGDFEKCLQCNCYYRTTDYTDEHWKRFDTEKKVAIIKKYCPDFDSDDFVHCQEASQKEKEEERIRLKQEQEELERKNKEAFANIILTTTPNIEGRRIVEYKQIVSGASIYTIGGLLGEGYFNKVQDSLFGISIGRAKYRLLNEAFSLGADAVINIQTALGGGPAAMNQMIVTLTGTAVVTEKITEE